MSTNSSTRNTDSSRAPPYDGNSTPLTINTSVPASSRQPAIQIPQLPPQFLSNYQQHNGSPIPSSLQQPLPPPHLDNSINNQQKPNKTPENSVSQSSGVQITKLLNSPVSDGDTKTLACGSVLSPISNGQNPFTSSLPPVHLPTNNNTGQNDQQESPGVSSNSSASPNKPALSNQCSSPVEPPQHKSSGRKKVKTRFPLARIKRIMQANEEVGKIATVAPHLISKSLELFMNDLISKTSQITEERNAKTLSAQHLKECIMNEETFDFLRDLVQDVPDHNKETKRGRKKRN